MGCCEGALRASGEVVGEGAVTDTPTYALFKDSKQISKPHSTQAVVIIEAYERSAIIVNHADFAGQKTSIGLASGYEIRRAT